MIAYLELYSWTLAAVLVAFMASIAVFYEMKFRTTTHYRCFLIPLVIFLVAALHAFELDGVLHETLELVGAISAMVLSLRLYLTMTGIKQ